MTPKNRNDLLTLWRFSKLDSVQQVAQNTDIMRLIFAELEPMFQYNRVVKEYNDPRFKSHSRRVFKESRANDVHPGRWLVHIIYPQLQQWPYHIVRKFEFDSPQASGFSRSVSTSVSSQCVCHSSTRLTAGIRYYHKYVVSHW